MTANIKYLPKYTRNEEVGNSITHFVGALFAISTFIIFLITGISKNCSFIHMLPFYVYSVFMFIMFFNSGFYHSRPFNSLSRAYSRIIDHCDIYTFVYATYLPIAIYGIQQFEISMFVILGQLLLCFTGIGLNAIQKESKVLNIITFFIYIIQGWMIAIVYPLNVGIPANVFTFILIGGILYSVGAILYGVGKLKRWSHTIFHVFVLIAAIIQFLGILLLV